ncbi:MAG: hypothetical protein ACYDAL_09380 [Candidatus Dormibacteraceae bacterium]
MPDLEQQLSALADILEWPPTPDLTSRWQGYLPAHRGRRESAGWGDSVGNAVQSWWAIAAAAVILAVAALAAYPPSREAIANWVNVHTIFQRVPHLATPAPQPPGPFGARLGLGGQTTLGDAQKQLAWQIAIPVTLGQPDEVYLQPPSDAPAEGEVTLLYAIRPGIPVAGQTGVSVLVTEARGAVDQNFFGKMLGPGATLEAVTVAGHQGYWISGPLHEFFFTDANGGFRSETVRLAANTLILDYGGTVIRIEGNLTRARALEIAASLG